MGHEEHTHDETEGSIPGTRTDLINGPRPAVLAEGGLTRMRERQNIASFLDVESRFDAVQHVSRG